VAGFWVIKAKDLDEAIEWARKVPFKEEGSTVEVRQIAGGDDFGDQVKEEVKVKAEEIRKKIEG
jgi:hypothetical protein